MKTKQKAYVGDYLPEDDLSYETAYCKIVEITENDGEYLYHLKDGTILSDDDFGTDDVRLESEIFG